LLSLLDTIKAAGAYIKALDDPWLDTTTPHGELILTVMGGLHELSASSFASVAMKASSERGQGHRVWPQVRARCWSAQENC
jgi:DNA invertase Pin-like site-specific DNA recombinase